MVQIVNARYEILTPISENAEEELKRIELAARTCYKSEDKITADSAKRMVKTLITNGHLAMLEHSNLSVKFFCDRAVANEIVRHRECSFAQESSRYCNYTNDKFGGDITVINIEPCIELDPKTSSLDESKKKDLMNVWENAMTFASETYKALIAIGATPQVARSVLPCSTKTELVVSANYREWRHILSLRTDISAHPQMREIMIPLLRELKSKIPIIFDDIEVKA